MKKLVYLLVFLLLFGCQNPVLAAETFDEDWEPIFTNDELMEMIWDAGYGEPGDSAMVLAMEHGKGPEDHDLLVLLLGYGEISMGFTGSGAMVVYDTDAEALFDFNEGTVEGDLLLAEDAYGDVCSDESMLFWLGGQEPNRDAALYVMDSGEFHSMLPATGGMVIDSYEGRVAMMGYDEGDQFIRFFDQDYEGPLRYPEALGDMSDLVYWDRYMDSEEIYHDDLFVVGLEDAVLKLSHAKGHFTDQVIPVTGLPADVETGKIVNLAHTNLDQLAFFSYADVACGIMDESMEVLWYKEANADPQINDVTAVDEWFYIGGEDGFYRIRMEDETPVKAESQGVPRALVQARVHNGRMRAEMEQFGLLKRQRSVLTDYLVPLRGAADDIRIFLPLERLQACLGPDAGDLVVLHQGEEIRIRMLDLDPTPHVTMFKAYDDVGVEVRLIRDGSAWKVTADFRGTEDLGSGLSLVHRVRLIP